MFINVTPHALNVRRMDGSTLVLPPSGSVARVATEALLVDTVDGIPVHRVAYGHLEGLPEAQAGVLYIASQLAAQAAAAQGRIDVLFPGPLIRGEDGQPVGCQGLSRP